MLARADKVTNEIGSLPVLAHSVSYCGAATCPELGVERTPSPTVSIRRFWAKADVHI